MAQHTYGQYCGLARALDVVGGRWSLLIIRELLIGARRYTDLKQALGGIASNLLTDRLKALQQAGIVRATKVPAPTPATLYELTALGVLLEPAVLALTGWGGHLMTSGRQDNAFDPRWLVIAFRSLLPAWKKEPGQTWTFEVDGVQVSMDLRKQGVRVWEGPAENPDLLITTSGEGALGLVTGRETLSHAEQAGRAEVRGTARARKLFSTAVKTPLKGAH